MLWWDILSGKIWDLHFMLEGALGRSVVWPPVQSRVSALMLRPGCLQISNNIFHSLFGQFVLIPIILLYFFFLYPAGASSISVYEHHLLSFHHVPLWKACLLSNLLVSTVRPLLGLTPELFKLNKLCFLSFSSQGKCFSLWKSQKSSAGPTKSYAHSSCTGDPKLDIVLQMLSCWW